VELRSLTNRLLIVATLLSLSMAQTDFNFSYELKYGNGKDDTYGNAFFENLLDINGTLNNSTSLYSQLEFSQPPLYGADQNGLDKIYFEYSKSDLDVTLGDLFILYGYGLGVNLSQDQALGYDNTLKGASWDYTTAGNLQLFGLIGQGNYEYAINAATGSYMHELNNKLAVAGATYGDLTFLFAQQKSFLDLPLLMSFYTDPLTMLEEDLNDRIGFGDLQPDTVRTNKYEVMYSTSFGPVDVYVEKLWSRYHKILGDRVSGSLLYTAVYANLFDWGITWDHKDYDMEYNLPSLSNPPLVFREPSSTLVGRTTHLMNYNDEIGHQFEINRSFGEAVNFLANWSFSRRHNGVALDHQYALHYTDMGENLDFFWEEDSTLHRNLKIPSMQDIALFNLNNEDYAFYPFREVYLEFFGDLFDDNLHWIVGYDDLNDVIKYHHQQFYTTDYQNFDTAALQDSISTHFNDYWWTIWGQNYFPEFGYDSTYADDIFNSVYDMTVDERITASNQQSLTSAQAIIETGGSIDRVSYSFERVEAYTIPTNFAFNFGGGNSLTLYCEFQKKKDITTIATYYPEADSTDDSFSSQILYTANYTALTYRLNGKWSFSILRDWEKKKWLVGGVESNHDQNTWTGYEFSWDINQGNQLSLFYGSLKGGRICANGICADQPDFADGVKLTYRAIF